MMFLHHSSPLDTGRGEMYLDSVLAKYQERDLNFYTREINQLGVILRNWASGCYLDTILSGSRAKGTAISLASDVDYLVSLTNNCNESNGGLRACYESLFSTLVSYYPSARRQNVSIRININGLEVDVTPARKQLGNTNNHNLYVSKSGSWAQTNIQTHIADILASGRTNEIKVLKIWRELHGLDIPSIYLEYLLIQNILLNKSKDPLKLHDNVWHALTQLAASQSNPLFARVVDPANSNNVLSDLLTNVEKQLIIRAANATILARDWSQVAW